jgi:hypothetical protein
MSLRHHKDGTGRAVGGSEKKKKSHNYWPTSGMGVMTPKRKTTRRAKARAYRKRLGMTPEQRAAERAYLCEYERKRRAKMTPEELNAYLAYKREYQRERQAAMTSRQLEAQRKYQREYRRKWRAHRAAEQLDAERARQRQVRRRRGK